jgi:hypothetical protein
MARTDQDLAPDLLEILAGDDLLHRTGGITTWARWATYVVQPLCPRVAEANQVREVDLGGGGPEELLAEVEEVFPAAGIQAWQVRLDPRTRPRDLGSFLAARGYRERRDRFYQLECFPALPSLPIHVLETTEDAVLQDFEAIQDLLHTEHLDGEACVQLAELRKYRREAGLVREFVGYFGGQPAAVISMLQLGRMVRLKDLFVASAFAGAGVEKAILSMVLKARFAVGATWASILEGDVGGRGALLQELGFEDRGEISIFERAL